MFDPVEVKPGCHMNESLGLESSARGRPWRGHRAAAPATGLSAEKSLMDRS
jgi:hypothetical protein